jgi:bacillithiol biosynthesis cysteine-adding enzyme BshC
MMAIPTKLLPHLSLLVRDYFYDFRKIQEFYNGNFRDPASFERQARDVQSRHLRREDLAAILDEQNRKYGCGPETLAQVEKIVRDRAGAVVTGQQVGLFSGPLYTIYKALTAVKLAEDLSRRGLGSFVPVFWLASDDHDLAEIDHITLLDKDNRLGQVRCQMPSTESRIPASNLVLPRDILDCVRKLEDMTLDTEFKADVIGRLSEAYEPGRTYVEAFALWMAWLFKAHGLILIDASDPRLKEMGSEIFYREVREDSPSTRRAIEASQRLRQAGYGAQIPLHEGVLNIFYADKERRSIHWKDGALNIKGVEASVRKEELLARAQEKPSLFSPNVLLRPIYQDALLPTVAYVGGQAEIAYFAQMKGVYEAFGLPMPVIYPRKNVTIVEKGVAQILNKYGLEIPDLWTQADGLIAEIAKKQVPDTLETALRRAHGHLEENFESLKAEVIAFEPTLKNSLDLARGKIEQQWKFVEKKIRQAAVKRNEIAGRQLRKAIDNVHPNQRLQERVFNIVPYLIKYGNAFLEKLDQAVDIGEHDHQVLLM